MKRAREILIAAVLACLVGPAGCKTDALWEERQSAEGPVTDLDSPEGVELPDIQIADAREVDLVEDVLMHRAMYHRHLRLLHDYYRDRGHEQKRLWADTELEAVQRIQPFKYLLSAQIPAPDLRPVDSIAEADAMYQRASTLMNEGGHGLPGLYREDLMLQALSLFVEMIHKFPSSDKIDDAAFFCGEIHKEYLKDQEPIAVRWYERAYTWDPDTPHSARFQAAVTYDYRLHDRARALELYRQVIDQENRNKSNVTWATARIDQLTRAEAQDVAEDMPEPRDMFGSPPE
ncbi:MAG: tetratricopeptide repeat protein [Planctomycetota bacterium]|jgi:hypothetical protein